MAKPNDKKDEAPDMNIPIEGEENTSDKKQADDTKAQAAASEAAKAAPKADAEPAASDDDVVAQAEKVVKDAAKEAADTADAVMAKAAEELKKSQAEVAEWKDKYLRLHAEWDTYRRRTNEQREEERVRATEKLVTNLLPILDDFERSIAYAENNGEAGLIDGVKAVQTKLVDTLTKAGVEVIDPAGEAFDALQHQAVATVDKTDVPDETVDQVYQKGYKMGKKVLRPAMVTVTSGGPKREKPKDDEEE